MKHMYSLGFPDGSASEESFCNVGDLGLIAGLGRSSGGGHGNPLQYSCLENPHEQRSLGRLQSMVLQTVGYNWASKHSTCILYSIKISLLHYFLGVHCSEWLGYLIFDNSTFWTQIYSYITFHFKIICAINVCVSTYLCRYCPFIPLEDERTKLFL